MNMTQTISSDECKQLSGSVIAMNPSRNGNKGVINSYYLDSYKELARQPWLAQLVAQIRALTQQQNELMAESMTTIDERLAGKVNENEEKLQQITKQIETLKKQLPFRSPHYFYFLDNHRARKRKSPSIVRLIASEAWTSMVVPSKARLVPNKRFMPGGPLSNSLLPLLLKARFLRPTSSR